jgi:phosphohistidine phosphatase
MPRLIFFRHAKAERTQPGGTDHERALTKSGRKDSAQMGEAIAEYGPVDLVLCSTARRAKETWDVASPAVDGSPEVRVLRAIYDADSYLPILAKEGGNLGIVLLVGHNPAMHEAALGLIADLSSAEGAILSVRFPKAAVAVLDFDGGWATLGLGQATLTAIILPRDS